jgi:hypothetical protein
MSRTFVACGVAYALACTAALAAQDPQTQAPAPVATAETVTVEGCLLREADVPGRKPPEAERQRVRADDDYVLFDAKVIRGTATAPAPAPEPTAPADAKPVGTSGTVASPVMFEVERIEKAQLTEHRGHRVQIDGMLKHAELARNDVSPAHDLMEIHGTAIRVVGGECPAK